MGASSDARDEEMEGLEELFSAAADAQRPRDELLRLVLSAALPLAGADLGLICCEDEAPRVTVARDDVPASAVTELAAAARRILYAGDQQADAYAVRLPLDPPAFLALRWARGRPSRPQIAHAIAGACTRLLGRIEDRVTGRSDGALDALTQLPARAATLTHLTETIAAAQRTGEKVGVLFIDLDGFKAVNDSFGHAAGDRALIEAARLMRLSARRGDFVGRLGGDEFVAVLGVVGDEGEMAEAAQRILDRVLIRVEEEGLVRVVGTSIGVAVYPQDGTTPDALLDHADHAMYAAKQIGRTICWYRDGVGRELHARRDLRERLRGADVERDFLVCYQPITETSTMRVTGVEALVRWRHPSRGWLAPSTFMPAGMALDISRAIDVFVVGAVMQALRSWRDDGLDVQVHVNISNTDEHVCSQIERILEHSGGRGDRLCIEIPAHVAFAEPERVGGFLRRLARFGVAGGLDNFGAEPIGLEALHELSLDFLKISRSITERAWHDERWRRVARSAIAFAHALEVRPLADGVQNAEQARWLAENGIEAVQGYFFAQPMTAPDFAEWMRSSRAAERDAYETIGMAVRRS